MIVPKYEGYTAVILGTGPTMNEEVVEQVRAARSRRDSGIRVFGVNNTFELDLPIDVFFACNTEWWDHYHAYPRMMARRSHSDLWTWDLTTARRYALNWIQGRWSGGKRNVTGLSKDPSYIHYGHGAGYEVLGIAYHYGCRHFVLCGYDLRYPRLYSSKLREPGGKRHFFGEYPRSLQHFPRVGPRGEMTGLLDCYRTIDTNDLGLRITNTSPGSALDFFEQGDLEKVLDEIHTSRVPVDG